MTHPFGKDPVSFLKKNLLTLSPFLDNPDQGLIRLDKTVRVQLIDVTERWKGGHFRHRRRKGLAAQIPRSNQSWWTKPARVLSVDPADPDGADGFAAYICPYVANKACFRMLDHAADVMFTGDMDGCTFGVGMPNASGGVYVGHVNAECKVIASEDGAGDDYSVQRQVQRDFLARHGAGDSVVDPDIYRQSVTRTHMATYRLKGKRVTGPVEDVMYTKAITIGLRLNGKWEFYYQHQVVDGGAQWREGMGLVKL